ncbi:Endosomal/prevacuolar sodium/hydrogen exchanger [Alternaria alternata]|nr:Endosomal/prevacuolar sodium/hydrogen exchanger [Alternaria alternata]
MPPVHVLTVGRRARCIRRRPGRSVPRSTTHSAIPSLMRPNRRARGGPEGDIHIMGPVHSDHPAHNSPLHQLHPTHAQDPGGP